MGIAKRKGAPAEVWLCGHLAYRQVGGCAIYHWEMYLRSWAEGFAHIIMLS